MTIRKALLAGLGVAILIVGVSVAMPVQTRPQPASATQSDKYDGDCTGNETVGRCADKPLVFDHSNCQYPDRWSNPADGCDNSDPAVPECIKAFSTEQGEKDCIAAFVAQREQPAATTPTVTPAPAKADQCGAK